MEEARDGKHRPVERAELRLEEERRAASYRDAPGCGIGIGADGQEDDIIHPNAVGRAQDGGDIGELDVGRLQHSKVPAKSARNHGRGDRGNDPPAPRSGLEKRPAPHHRAGRGIDSSGR